MIGAIRRLARPVAAGGFGIETIARTGYRLTGATVAREAVDPAVPKTPGPYAPPSRPSRRLLTAGGAVAIAAAVAGAGSLWSNDRTRGVADLVTQARLAIKDGLPESADRAVTLLRQAVARRPDDAALWGALALAWRAKSEFAHPSATASAVQACQLAASRALAINPKQADARTALIILRPTYGDWLAVERGLRAVLADAPGNEDAAMELAELLQAVGRSRACGEISDLLATRLALSPVYQYRRGYVLWNRARVGEADRTLDRALALWPRHPNVWFARLWLSAFTGRADAAIAHVKDIEAMPPGVSRQEAARLRTSLVALRSRAPGDIQAAVAANLAAARAGPGGSVPAIMILSFLGRLDEAFTMARGYLLRRGASVMPLRAQGVQAVATDTRHRHTQVLFVPVTAPLRADPRFLPMCEACGLADYWRQAGHQPDFLSDGRRT